MSHNPNSLLGEQLLVSIDRLVLLFTDLSSDQVNWRMPVEGANSLYGITVHVVGSAEETLAILLKKDHPARNQQEEFSARGSLPQLLSWWAEKRRRLVERLAMLSDEMLQGEYIHPRKHVIHPASETITGNALLLRALQHANEHLGQAQIIRDFLHVGDLPLGVW